MLSSLSMLYFHPTYQVDKSRSKEVQQLFAKGFGVHHAGKYAPIHPSPSSLFIYSSSLLTYPLTHPSIYLSIHTSITTDLLLLNTTNQLKACCVPTAR